MTSGTTVAQILGQLLDDWDMRFQDPSIQKTKGKHPKWFIRPVVPIYTGGAIVSRQKVLTLGRCAEMTRKEAERAKQAKMAEINGGSALITAQVKVSDLIAEFQRVRLPLLAASTQEKYAAHLRNHVGLLGDMQLFEVTPQFVQGWLLSLKLGGWAKLDVKNLLSAMFEQARKWRLWSEANPIADVDLPRLEEKREKRIPSEDQIRRLRVALDCCGAVASGVSGPDVRLMLDVAMLTGWRVSEILGLRTDAIDGEVLEVRRTWIRGELRDTPKTRAGRRRNWVGPMAAELKARARFGFVFCGDDEVPPDDRDIQQHILRPCAEAAGCYWPGFGFHVFRRLNNTYRQQAGATLPEVMRAMGHTSAAMTAHYTVTDLDRERAVVGKIQGRVQ
jgi:integrase